MGYKLILFFVFLSKILQSQPTYKKFTNRFIQGKAYELASGNTLLCMGGGFANINSSGEVNYYISYFPSIIITDFFRLEENKLAFIGAVIDSCQGSTYVQAAYFVTDTVGNILSQKRYVVNGSCGLWNFGDSYLKSDKGFLICASGFRPGVGYFDGPCIISTDSSGQLLWSKYFDNYTGGVQFVSELADKSIVAGFNLDVGGAVLIRFDSLGNTIWTKSYIRPRGFLHSILPENDGTFLITGNTDSLLLPLNQQFPNWFHPTLFLMKLDTAGQIIWSKEYDDSTSVQNYFTLDRSHILKLSDGSYTILCGKYPYPNPNVVMLLNVDSNGNPNWNRSHGPQTIVNICTNFMQYSDGGYLVSERTYGNYPNLWSGAYEIIRTDSLGHSQGCFEFTENVNGYPYFPVDSNMTLISIDGGYSTPANITDTLMGQIIMYDECIVLNGNETLPFDNGNFILIYPNPVSDVLHVSLTQTENESSLLEIFDAYGKKVFEKSVAEGTDKIDLNISDLTNGVYQLRLMNEKDYSVNQFLKN